MLHDHQLTPRLVTVLVPYTLYIVHASGKDTPRLTSFLTIRGVQDKNTGWRLHWPNQDIAGTHSLVEEPITGKDIAVTHSLVEEPITGKDVVRQ